MRWLLVIQKELTDGNQVNVCCGQDTVVEA
jgi:hypothetical protein